MKLKSSQLSLSTTNTRR